MFRNIEELIKSFNTNPILFMGSGITRRYYSLPSWSELLNIFSRRINKDEFVYLAYINKAKQNINSENELYPKIADLIENDFNEYWFNNENFREKLDANYIENIKQNCSPFKAEVAQFIKSNSILNNEYIEEIEELKRISRKNIASIITTNYDNFFEENIVNFKTYIGQEELIFSNIQGIGEIYKIHGSIEKPESIIINSKDYKEFNNKGQYLAAKLLTLFMEYPIIFIGYSISDSNIQNILSNIIKCLPQNKVGELKNRFIFIEYDSNIKEYEIDQHAIKIENKLLEMNKIKLSDFSILYKAIGGRKRTLSVKLLRDLKEQLSEFILTNEPNQKIKVAMLNSDKIEEEDLAIAIGKIPELPIKGLQGITANEWYRNIVLEDLNYDENTLLKCGGFLLRQNSGILPLNKYLSKCKDIIEFENLVKIAMENDLEHIISNTIKKNRKCVEMYNSADEIWKIESNNIERATRLIAHLEIEKFNVDELENILREIFSKNNKILEEPKVNTNVKRLIRIYDYLKYSDKVKELFN